MNKWISSAIIFVGGIGSGFLAGWLIRGKGVKKEKERLDKEWAEIMQLRTEAVLVQNAQTIVDIHKDLIKNDKTKNPGITFEKAWEDVMDTMEPKDRERVEQLVREEGYSTTAESEHRVDGHYLINDDEYGNIDDYETICLTYYVDGHLVRDDGEEVSVDETIGSEALNHFSENDDLLYVRNDILKEDYEVLFSGEVFMED